MSASYKFSWNEATKMGLTDKDNWVKMPRTMLNWRTLTFTARFLAPRVMMGMHTIDEIADMENIPYIMDEDGNTILFNEEGEQLTQTKKSNGEAEIQL